VVVRDGSEVIAKAVRHFWPEAVQQECLVHVERGLCGKLSWKHRAEVVRRMKRCRAVQGAAAGAGGFQTDRRAQGDGGAGRRAGSLQAYWVVLGLRYTPLKLHTRLTTVTEIYNQRRKWLRVSDRNEQAIIKSRSILNTRFQVLSEIVKTKRANDSERHRPKNYENEWSSLSDMCQLLMDENTHLKNRIHDFDGIHRVRLGFGISLAGIFISVVIGAAGLIVGLANLTKDYWSDPVKPIVRKLFTSPTRDER
jgi:hypothetical protein